MARTRCDAMLQVACRRGRACPTGVDMARMKIEVPRAAARADRHSIGAREALVASLRAAAPFAARLAPLANLRNAIRPAGRLEANAGSASPPRVSCRFSGARDFFRDAEADALAPTSPRGEVLLLADVSKPAHEPKRRARRCACWPPPATAPWLPVNPRGRPLCCGHAFLAAGVIDKAPGRGTTHVGPAGRHAAGRSAWRPSVPVHTLRDEFRALLP